MLKSAIFLACSFLILFSESILAQSSPPILTNDPGTPGPGNWEINILTSFEHSAVDDEWLIPLLDFNYGVGSDNVNDIISVLQYDDDGAERVRTHWECSGDPIELIISESSDDNILLKYVSEVESVDMSFLKDDTQRQLALDYLLARWETPRPVIEIETKFMGSVVTLLSKVTFNIRGDVLPQTGRFVLDVSKIDGADVLCKELGGVISDPSYEWMVVRIYENLNDFTMRIKAEKL